MICDRPAFREALARIEKIDRVVNELLGDLDAQLTIEHGDDSIYIYVGERSAIFETREACTSPLIFADYDSNGVLLGIEIIGTSA